MKATATVWAGAALALLGLCGAPPRTGAQPGGRPAQESTRLRALIVCDTKDPVVGKSVAADAVTFEQLLKDGFAGHADRLVIKKFTGADVTVTRILDHLRGLKTGSTETVLFFFAGHGATSRRYGHMLQVQDEKKGAGDLDRFLLRSEVRGALLEKQPRLAVLLTDTCSDFVKLGTERPVQPRPEWETMRSLFLVPRGLVDVNSVSEGESATGQEDGGLFVRTLDTLLRRPFAKLDLDRDKFLHWHELLPSLQETTQKQYASLRLQELAALREDIQKAGPEERKPLEATRDKLTKQLYQTVRVYSLPPLHRFGVRALAHGKKGARVALVHEHTPAAAAGLKPGDLIRKLGNWKVTTPKELAEAVAKSQGETVVEFERGGAAMRADVTLSPWPAVKGTDL
jgi:hypothetical protein